MKKTFITLALSAAAIFVLAAPAQADEPVISDIAATVSLNSVKITWTTDVATTGTLDYGTESGVYTAKQLTPFSLVHAVTLTGLVENTTHYYQINVEDDDGNVARSAEKSFKTKTSKLTFVDIHVTALGSRRMVVKAETNKDAFSSLCYGTSQDSLTKCIGASQQFSSIGELSHFYVVRDLQPVTTYYFQATGQTRIKPDGSGGEKAKSDTESVTTRKATKITSISRTKGGNGTKLTIRGQGFGGGHSSLNPSLNTFVGIGCTTCRATVLSWTDSKIVVQVGKKAKTGPVYVGKSYTYQTIEQQPTAVIYTVKGPTFTVSGQ